MGTFTRLATDLLSGAALCLTARLRGPRAFAERPA